MEEGKAYLYLGTDSGTGLSTIPDWTSSGDDQASAYYGWSVSSAGDVNGDGFDDVIVAAPRYDTANLLAGKAYLYLGLETGLYTTPGWTSPGDDQAQAYYGWSVSSAGDVNGDGFDDIVVGASGHDSATINAGKAYLHLGAASGPCYPVGSACDDGDACTSDDVCDAAGLCVGTPYTCTPGLCETSSCDGAGGCTVGYQAPGAACDDGDSCTFMDLCDGSGGCAGTPYSCTLEVCEATSTCDGAGGCTVTHRPPGAACDDDDMCTHTDICDGSGACAGTPYTCTVGACEASSSCDGAGGCTVTYETPGTICDDGDSCTHTDACDVWGGCTGICPATIRPPHRIDSSKMLPKGSHCLIGNVTQIGGRRALWHSNKGNMRMPCLRRPSVAT